MIFKEGDLVGGRFLVKKTLGNGAAGIVYLVEDNQRGEAVALKILRPELTQHELAIERFMREVKAVREIAHDGIVPVYETGRLGDTLFYTMEWVRGDNLQRVIKRDSKLETAKAVAIVIELCEILEKVHEVAIHRDIAAENIMLQEDGRIRLLDFGTARVTEIDSNLTQTSIHLGRIVYSAPEQRANAKKVDHRADLYSASVLLYELLTGELVIAYEPVTRYLAELDPAFDAFFEKAMAEDPETRFQSAAKMKDALTKLPYSASGN